MKTLIYRTSVLMLAMLSFTLCSCSDDKSFTFPDPEPTYEMVDMVNVFGFYNQDRYSYCPSVTKDADGTAHMFLCGNPDEQIMVDNIYYVRINPDGTQTAPKSVLQPTPDTWDSFHTCDPSVIAGDFKMGGKSYKYAMFFLGNKRGRYFNEVGVAFSNEIDADDWVKYPHQLVEKTWEGEEDQVLSNGSKSWGVGQPSAVSLDHAGKILLTYTSGDAIATRVMWSEIDMSDMDNYVAPIAKPIVSGGLKQINKISADHTANIDFAINVKENIIMMIRPVHPHPTSYPAFLPQAQEINYMPLNAFLASIGSWNIMLRITPQMTGYPRNHNATIERDMYGEIEDWRNPTVYYTVSKATPDVASGASTHAEWTYRIWKAQVKEKRSTQK